MGVMILLFRMIVSRARKISKQMLITEAEFGPVIYDKIWQREINDARPKVIENGISVIKDFSLTS